MASGHEQCRINRPNTWQLRPAVRYRSKTLANKEPSTHEITEHLEQERNLRVAPSTVWRFFDRHDVTFKKNRTR
jgi:transposase